MGLRAEDRSSKQSPGPGALARAFPAPARSLKSPRKVKPQPRRGQNRTPPRHKVKKKPLQVGRCGRVGPQGPKGSQDRAPQGPEVKGQHKVKTEPRTRDWRAARAFPAPARSVESPRKVKPQPRRGQNRTPPSPRSFKSPTRSKKTFAGWERFFLTV